MIPCLKLNQTKPTLRSEDTRARKRQSVRVWETIRWTLDISQIERPRETQTSQTWHHEKWAGTGLEGASVEAGEVERGH